MEIETFADEETAARAAAAVIATEAERRSLRAGALSWLSAAAVRLIMMGARPGRLAVESFHVLQVDERGAAGTRTNLTPSGEPARHSRIPPNIHAMPVEAQDLDTAAMQYAATRRNAKHHCSDLCPPGLGPDGHTASLVPGDPVTDESEADVTLTGLYQGRRRMTLTYPVINRARKILWLVTGSEKSAMLARLYRGDSSIPAGRVSQERAVIIADRSASRTIAVSGT
jgi:6-phosphogluconolactonase